MHTVYKSFRDLELSSKIRDTPLHCNGLHLHGAAAWVGSHLLEADMYNLSRTQSGHAGDVKGVKFSETGILSVSRDGTAQVDGAPIFELGVYLNSCAANGIQLFCGSQDGTIASMNIATNDQLYFMGHTSNVCSLDASVAGKLVSGSWDKTARVWDSSAPEVEPVVLEGHTEAVWAVLILSNGDILTGSADKKVIRWANGKKAQVYEGHTDAVRGLCQIDADTFASCSNDTTIRVWKLDGSSTILRGHTSFVYSVAYDSGTLVSSGEDRTVRVWEDNAIKQVLTLPCVSQWSVDIQGHRLVVGSSDHKVRVFSSQKSEWASEQELEEFSKSLESSALGEDQVGRIDESELKPESHLKKPGNEGEFALVRSNGVIIAHQYTGGKWIKVGEVTGKSSDGSKQSHDGREYDYVFDVDIKDGEPPLKLPYNNSDNPYTVAEKFVSDNDLPATYVEQVVQFLISNSSTTHVSSANASNSSSALSAAPSAPPANVPSVLNFSQPLQMVAFQLEPMVKAFNQNAAKYGKSVDVEPLIRSLPSSGGQLLTLSLEAANQWELADKLSALDLIRLSIPSAESVPFIALISVLLGCLDADVPKHALLATRGLANLLSRHDAFNLMSRNTQPFQQGFQMLDSFPAFTKPLQIAVATLTLNAVLANTAIEISPYIVRFSSKINDPEAGYRLALAAGVRATRVAGDRSQIKQLDTWLSQFKEDRFKELKSAIKF